MNRFARLTGLAVCATSVAALAAASASTAAVAHHRARVASSAPGSSGPGPAIAISRSTTSGFLLHVGFPKPSFRTNVHADTQYTEMLDADLPSSHNYGEPETPLTSVSFAVPVGATYVVKVVSTTGYNKCNVRLWPAQHSDVAAQSGPDFVPKPLNPAFVQDTKTYTSKTQYPKSLVHKDVVAPMRDLQVATITLSAAGYFPSTHRLHVLTGETLQVTFGGRSEEVFGPSTILSPWEGGARSMYEGVVNWGAVTKHLRKTKPPRSLCGEELLIIASNATKAAAEKLAAARDADGILSRVVLVGQSAVGTTHTTIRSYIAGQLHSKSCGIHPSYVLLVGDTRYVPTWKLNFGLDSSGDPNFPEQVVPSDHPYTFIHQAAQFDAGHVADLNPDLAIARITGDGTTTMNAVDKIISYEDDPTTQSSFYTDAVNGSWFQDCPNGGCVAPTTPNTTQEIVPFLFPAQTSIAALKFDGKTVNRRWIDTAGDTPQLDYAGNPLPSGVSYAATTAQVQSDINAGRFLAFQNDHGSSSGWIHPPLTTSAVSGLHNKGLYPVVWSFDCDTGDFDRYAASNPDFTEAMLGAVNAGAVGMVGSSRESYISWDGIVGPATTFAAFPQEVNAENAAANIPGYDPTVFPAVTRLGDTTNVALQTVYGYRSSAADVAAAGTVLEYNTFGDPTMYMWTSAPHRFALGSVSASKVDSTHVKVQLAGQSSANGANVTLRDDGVYVGRGVLHSGAVTLSSTTAITSSSRLQVIFEKGGWVSGRETIDLYKPQVTSVSPAHGVTTGGTHVTIKGHDLGTASAVKFGSINATSFQIANDSKITAVAPSGVGKTDVFVTNSHGQSGAASGAAWTWSPVVSSVSPSSGAAGTTVTIAGTALVGVSAVKFGSHAATSFTSVNSHKVTAVAPAGSGTVTVTVVTSAGSTVQASGGDDTFTYTP